MRWKSLPSLASDLDAATKEQLQHGHGLMELLKQPLCRPLSTAEQVITLCAANAKVFLPVPVQKIKEFQMTLLEDVKQNHPEIIRQIESGAALDASLNQAIVDAAVASRDAFLSAK